MDLHTFSQEHVCLLVLCQLTSTANSPVKEDPESASILMTFQDGFQSLGLLTPVPGCHRLTPASVSNHSALVTPT